MDAAPTLIDCNETPTAAFSCSALLPVPTRPVLRYHGGKWMLAPWIISNFPKHRIYVEPFGGAASVLMQKPRCYAEAYNDLSGEVVNLFRVLRDNGAALRDALRLTPFGRDEYRAAFERTEDPLESARRLVVRSFQGFGSNSIRREVRSGFRNNANRSGTTPAHDWVNFPDCMDAMIARLQGVIIENKNALDLMQQLDGPETLHYCDPPYPHGTRMESCATKGYDHEMMDDDHRAMAAVLNQLKGMVIVSGYACSLYDDELFAGWRRVERKALADGARERTEVLWMRNVQAHGLLPGLDG